MNSKLLPLIMVNLEWYRTFKAVYQHRNLTRAAEELLISQPNVSVQLAALEAYVGHKLFERQPRKLVPTTYGELLYTQVVGSIENLERVESEFRKIALQRLENLRIGTPIEYAHNILLEKLGVCSANIALQFGVPHNLIDALEKADLDFVIATQKVESDKVVYEPLIKENFMIVAHATYDALELEKHIGNGDIDLVEKWLLEQDWIAYDSKLSMIRRFWRENFQKRPLIKPRYIIPDINMMLKAVHLKYGITVASDLLTTEGLSHQRLRVLWKGNDQASNQLWLAYNPLSVTEGQLKEMKDILSREANVTNL